MNKETNKIFLSHAAVDTRIAEYLETTIQQNIKNASVFRTTRIGQIPSGTEWFSTILKELKLANKYMVLLTPWSMSRPWVCFETGAAWMTDNKLVVVVAGGMSKGDVVEPLKDLQLLSLEIREEAERAFADLGGKLPNGSDFVQTIQALSMDCRDASLAEDEWDIVNIDGVKYAWDGPLEKLSDGNPKPLPPEKYPDLQKAGLQLVSARPDNLLAHFYEGYSILYLVDFKRKRKHRLLTKEHQILLIKKFNSN